MKGAILGVMATNKMKAGFLGLLTAVNNLPNHIQTTQEVVTEVPKVEEKKPATSFLQVTLKIIEARDLSSKTQVVPSTYVNIWSGASKRKTNVIQKSSSPVWNESFVLPPILAKKSLEVEVFNEEELLGSVRIEVESIPLDGVVNKWFPLTSAHKGAKVTGEVHLELSKANFVMASFISS